ncbi:O-antigen ligase like membrane protein [Prevotella sp. khp7]|uniref:O-antigen ligase family protein n=1 Tax=Prevotella sp. khp7 TaxID=1761885 RepID=UPI0008B36BA5|nr:O-antigen ligase family protein [Prevotella sp. khp7]SEW23975.1 O-antigen ligase like membrane protein [Prevotella sp. khp7]
MVAQRKSIFDNLRKSEAYIITAYSILVLFFATRMQDGPLVAISLLFSFLGFFRHRGMALGAIIISGPFVSLLSTGFYYTLAFVPFLLSSFIDVFKRKKRSKLFGVYLLCLSIVLISFAFGYKPDGVTLALQIICMTIFFTISESFTSKDVPIVIFSYICSAVLVCLFLYAGGLESMTGRLTFGENVKTMAFLCAIPMSFLLFSFIGKVYLFENLKKRYIVKIIDGALLLLFLLVTFMTLARGLMLALALGVILLALLSPKSIKSSIVLVLVAALTLVAYIYIESLGLFRTERLFEYEEFETGNGRTEIWIDHLNKISSLGEQYIILGTGPGNIARISSSDAYAHSMIFDYYFSYGVIGFLVFILIEFLVLRRLYIKTNIIPFVIVVTFLIAYATHGGAANPPFFILQALMLASINNNLLKR